MRPTRRDVLITTAGAAAAAATGRFTPTAIGATPTTTRSAESIDRREVVRRHNPRVTRIDPFAALSIGNGEFCFTADVTGLQTFPEQYEKTFPLCTTAHWAWHSAPLPAGLDVSKFRYKQFDTYGRPVPYATDSSGQEELFKHLRENPHRVHLGRIGLELRRPDGTRATPDDLTEAAHGLDLWTGMLNSRFVFQGQPVMVVTCVHPTLDLLAVRVASPQMRDRVGVEIVFPYPVPERPMGNFNSTSKHRTRVSEREIDETRYRVAIACPQDRNGQLLPDEHRVVFRGDGDGLELVFLFSSEKAGAELPSFEQTAAASAEHWERFWSTGGAVDLAGSTNAQAKELERRTVLSQYNTALHCAGSLPSQETGLLFHSWYGKFHLEMHWWHSVHFAQWDRFPLIEKTLSYYQRILPEARAIAQRQGFRGARWPKMVGPEGKDSPSPVGPLLIWQQPHPIYYAELCYRRTPDRATLERWRSIVEASAEFMASYAHLVDGRYVLGPPMKTVSENADTLATINPTFELSYWRWALDIAQQWRQRLGESRVAAWDEVLAKLSPLPTQDGLYLMQEGMTDTYTKWNWEHPALLMPASLLPPDLYDRETMRRTVRKVMEVWQWDRAWGWDFPVASMAAARVGEADLAVQALLVDSVKNRYHPNGHVYQRENLTAYLPANGGLLAAIATIATSCGFPASNGWSARHEHLSALP